MITVNIKKQFKIDIKKLWEIVTNNENYFWRSDLSKIEITDETHFTEYAQNNYPTYFEITKKEPFKLYSFNIKNSNIKGKWIGKFKEISPNLIELDFTEEIEVSNIIMKLFAKSYLKKQQQKYIEDLEKEIKKVSNN